MSSIKVETIPHASNVHVTAFFAQQKLRNGVLVVFVRFAPSSCEMNHWILMQIILFAIQMNFFDF